MKNNSAMLIFIMLINFTTYNSCNANGKEKQISSILEKDSVMAPYFNALGFYENDSGIYFYGLRFETIYLYKENAEGHFELDSYIQLPEQYTAGKDISEVEQLVFINMDSIIIYHKNNIALISTKQDSLLKIFYHSRDDDWFNFIARGNTFLRWNKKRNTLPVIIFRWDDHDKRTWRGDTEIFAEYSFEKDTFSIFPVKLPYHPYNTLIGDYSENDPFFAFNGDTFVFGFQITPVTYLYNAGNRHMDSLFIQNSMYVPLPEYDTARIREISIGNFLHEVILEHNFYTGIVYDEYNRVYYRFFNKAMPRKNAEGLLNTMEDKEFGLTVLDTNLQIIGDVSWPWQEHCFIQYPTSKGLYGYSQEHRETIIYKRKLIYEE